MKTVVNFYNLSIADVNDRSTVRNTRNFRYLRVWLICCDLWRLGRPFCSVLYVSVS